MGSEATDAARRHARHWQREEAARTAAVFVPLAFDPSEAYPFDWSHEQVARGGGATKRRLRTCGCATAGYSSSGPSFSRMAEGAAERRMRACPIRRKSDRSVAPQ